MRNLSKSKLLYYRQCPKRLWLEIHHHELRIDSPITEASFATGKEVGDIARRIPLRWCGCGSSSLAKILHRVKDEG